MINEVDISKVLIEGDTATIMGVKYKRIEEPKSPAEEAYKEVYGWYPPTTSSVSNYEDNRWSAFQNGYNASKVSETPQEPEELKTLYKEQRTKTPVEECYKDWWGQYPETGTWDSFDDKRWQGFQAGYHLAYEEKVVEEPEEQVSFVPKEIKELVKEGMKWCEEHPDKDPLDWLKPQTPEQTAQSLKEAFVEAQQTENWKETQKLIDEEDNDKNFKNSLDLIKEWGEKNKPPTLKELLWEWWEDIFTVDADLDADASIDVLVDIIDKKFIPPSSEKNGYEWEKCLKMMREKLR